MFFETPHHQTDGLRENMQFSITFHVASDDNFVMEIAGYDAKNFRRKFVKRHFLTKELMSPRKCKFGSFYKLLTFTFSYIDCSMNSSSIECSMNSLTEFSIDSSDYVAYSRNFSLYVRFAFPIKQRKNRLRICTEDLDHDCWAVALRANVSVSTLTLIP